MHKQPFDDTGVCQSEEKYKEYWTEIHSAFLKEDLKDIKGFDSFENGFKKLPDECRKLLIQLHPMLYRYYREERVGRKQFLEHMVDAMRLLRKEYCRRKDGQYVLKGDAPNIVQFLGRLIGNDRIVDFRITQEARRAAAGKAQQ